MEPPNITKDETPQHHLGDKINIATRSAHTKLNKSLLLRLPLALPPKASTPSVYVSGLIHVASIYIAFESPWREIISIETKEEQRQNGHLDPACCRQEGAPLCNDDSSENGDPLSHNTEANSGDRIHSMLSYLHLPILERSASLRADIRSITGWSEDVVDEQINQAAERGGLGEFIAHIRRSVDQRPHVLLAYAWVLYMALFSGGRFIRGSLENAGAEFWSSRSDPVLPSMLACEEPVLPPSQDKDNDESATNPEQQKPPSTTTPLQFFRFATPQDGEDLKTEFKKRLVEAESRLTNKEQEDIVQEASCIFDYMNLLVTQLDCVFAASSSSSTSSDHAHSSQCATPTASSSSTSPSSYASSISSSLESWARLLIPGAGGGGPRNRLRDSVAIAKERGVRGLSRGSSKDRSSAGSYSSVTSSDWDGRMGSSAAGASISSVMGAGASAVPGVSILQVPGKGSTGGMSLSSSAPTSPVLGVEGKRLSQGQGQGQTGEGGGGGEGAGELTRSKSVRFGKDVVGSGGKKSSGGIVRGGTVRSRQKKRSGDAADPDGTATAQGGGLDGAVDGYEFDDEYDEVDGIVVVEGGRRPEEKSSPVVEICPVVVEKEKEKHVRFLTPDLDSGSGSGSEADSSSPVKLFLNGVLVMGLVGVVIGVGRFTG